MKKDFKKIAQALYQAIDGKKPKEIDTIIDNFIAWLQHKRLSAKRREIIEALEVVRQKAEKQQAVTVYSRIELTETQQREIQKYLEVSLKSKILLRSIIDTSIIGGYRLEYGDTVYDVTLNKQLTNLQRHLLQS